MPNTKITSQKLKDHWSYSKRVYIIGALVAALCCNLLYSVTRYQAPDEYAVHIALVDTYVAQDKLDDVVPALLAAGQASDSTLELVTFSSIAYSGNPDSGSEMDYYGAQVYMVQISVGENDIYLQNLSLMEDLMNNDFCVPLETLSAFEDFTERYPDVQFLWREEPDPDARPDEEPDPNAPARPRHAYAVDVSTLNGMAQRGAYDQRGKYACVVRSSANIETSFEVLCAMFDQLSSPAEAAQ